jgi:predicted NBD/HSP70 family sugar kinase
VLAERAEQLARSGQSPFLAGRLLERGSLHAGDLQDATLAGDEPAAAALRESASLFATGIRSVVAAVDPARVVLVGALLSDDAPFGDLVRGRWAAIRPAWSSTPLVHVLEDEDATLLGAARLAEHAVS